MTGCLAPIPGTECGDLPDYGSCAGDYYWNCLNGQLYVWYCREGSHITCGRRLVSYGCVETRY